MRPADSSAKPPDGLLSLFRDEGGRLRTASRVGLFYLLVLGVWIGLSLVLALGIELLGPVLPTWLELLLYTGVGALAALAGSYWLAERVEGIPIASLGLPVDALLTRDLGRGFLVGGAVIGVAVLLLVLTGALRWTVAPGGMAAVPILLSLLRMSVFLAVAALAEELLFRGYPFLVLAGARGPVTAVVVTSLLFSLLHTANPGFAWLGALNIALAGALLGVAFWRTRSLWFATGVHLGWNWVMGFLADLPVSGLEPGTAGYAFFDTPGVEAVVRGPGIWTGGAFGPEGGLAVTVATLLGIGWLAVTERVSQAKRVLAAGRPAGRRGPAGGDDGRRRPRLRFAPRPPEET